jgi:hypothetical protein
MSSNPFGKKLFAVLAISAILFSGWPFSWVIPAQTGRIIDNSIGSAVNLTVPQAEAAPKTKTIVFFVGSNVSTTAIASAATSTYSFVISLPDMVPTAQPIRSAYIQYVSWWNNTTNLSAAAFTLNEQGGTAQTLAVPANLVASAGELDLSMRLNATAALQTLIGNASGTYAMTFTAKLTGPTRMAEGAELYITYDYDPFAATQMNTVYQYAYATSSLIGSSTVASPSFNFNLPESNATTTFAVGASSTNQFWMEYRGSVSTSTSLTIGGGWNAETMASATLTEATEAYSFLMLIPPKTANTSPSAANTFSMSATATATIANASAIGVATYSFNFASSTTRRKTIQLLLMQSTSTTSTSTINATTSITIPESSPSSTDAFLFGRLAYGTSTQPGINAYMTTSTTCTFPVVTTPYAQATTTTEIEGYPTVIRDIAPSSTVNTAGAWTICSTFTVTSTVANICGMSLYLSYNYANNSAAGQTFDNSLSFLGVSNVTATGTTFAATSTNASVADASDTPSFAWLSAEIDNDGQTVATQTLTLGIGNATSAYGFVQTATKHRAMGATFSVTSTIGSASTSVSTTVQCSSSCINDATLNIFGQTSITAANLTQAHYHWRNNNGSESGATAAANEDTSTTVATASIIRLRFEVNNAGDATSTGAFRLEYQQNATSGAWTQVATSTVGTAAWAMATSSQVADDTATTQIATSTGGTDAANIFFLPGEVVASTSRNQTNSYTITGTQFTEDEFAIEATANALTSTAYYFRVSNAGTALKTYSVYPAIDVMVSAPTVTNVVLNNAASITLTPNATTSISVVASTTDPGGPGNISYATGTIYRTSLGASCTANNANCYQIASSSCIFTGSTSTVTCTAGLYYFAQSTGNASSNFPSDSWTGAISVVNGQGGKTLATSTGQNVNVLTAINITTSSINYGTLIPSSTTGSADQTTTVTNAGNSSTTLQLSGTAFVKGAITIATSSQHYATTTFTFGGSESQLSGSPTTVSGFVLSGATSTTNVSGTIFWGDTVPVGVPTGTYTASTTFTSAFSQ